MSKTIPKISRRNFLRLGALAIPAALGADARWIETTSLRVTHLDLAGSGAMIGGIADRSWKGAGIGAGIGSGVGVATVLLTRGKEVDLSQGTTLDVVFDRPVVLE